LHFNHFVVLAQISFVTTTELDCCYKRRQIGLVDPINHHFQAFVIVIIITATMALINFMVTKQVD